MPVINTVNTNPAPSRSEADPSISPRRSPFPYSPDSYCLPTSITSPSNPESSLLPTNSPTFLVSKSDFKPAFKVPTSPAHRDTRDGINSYVEWVEENDEEDENEGLIMFPSYHDSASTAKKVEAVIKSREEDFEPFAAEQFADDSSSEGSTYSGTEIDSDSNASSRSSSPSLEGEEFNCDAQRCETWRDTSYLTPEPTTLPFFYAEDDLSLSTSCQPDHCVDFLAHAWKTSDLLASYKHVHAHRDGLHVSTRLENALCRVWWRDHRGLKRVDPEIIHWAKDSDNTWLYGPFAPCPTNTLLSSSAQRMPSQALSCTNVVAPSSAAKVPKSLLKKRDPAKSMAERARYAFSLLREATGFCIPSPVPEAVSKFPAFNAQGRVLSEKKGKTEKRVVFNEFVTLYREVVVEEEPQFLFGDGQEPYRDFDPIEFYRDFDQGCF